MKINSYIDHTLLKPNISQKEITNLCMEAIKYNFSSVCVNSVWTKFVADILKESSVSVCTVVGFPLGAMNKNAKTFEAKQAIEEGANEIDMVIDIASAISEDLNSLVDDILPIVDIAHESKAIVKTIIETSLLTYNQKILACKAALCAKADFVKTSTGFNNGGATIDDVKLMRKIVGDNIGVKASGGIRSIKDALQLISAGASRLGTSSGVYLVNGIQGSTNNY